MDRQSDEERLRAINPRRWELSRRASRQFLTPEEQAELAALGQEVKEIINRLHPVRLSAEKGNKQHGR